jgi:hypothetical protein
MRRPRRLEEIRRNNILQHKFLPSAPSLEPLRPPLHLGEAIVIPGLTRAEMLSENPVPLPRRLRRCLPAWKALLGSASHPLLSAIAKGFKIPGVENLSPPAKFSRPNTSSAMLHREFVSTEVCKLLKLGVLKEVPLSSALGIMAISVVEAGGKLRLVVDGSPLNDLLPAPNKFAYEDLAFLSKNISGEASMSKFDARLLYYHLPLHKSVTPWVCVVWEGRCYSFQALPLGLSHAPLLATSLMAPIVSALRLLEHLDLCQYLDDGLVWDSSPSRATVAAQLYVHLLARLGILLHPEKCSTEPSRKLDFLGFTISTELPGPPLASLTSRRRWSIVGLCKQLRQASKKQTQVPVKLVARLNGLVVSTTVAFEPSLALLLPLFKFVSESVDERGWCGRCVIPLSLLPTLTAIKDMMAASLWCERPLCPPTTPEIVLTTDASSWGWSAYLSSPLEMDAPSEVPHQARWPDKERNLPLLLSFNAVMDYLQQQLPEWKPDKELQLSAKVFDRLYDSAPCPVLHGDRHSTQLESVTLFLALLRFAPRLFRKNLVARSDNITALAALRRGTSRSPLIARIGLLMRFTMAALQIRLVAATHIPGVDNISADEGSRGWLRQHARLEWPCDEKVLHQCLTQVSWPLPQIDAFATAQNSKCPQFWSLLPDPLSAGTDAMAQLWTDRSLFLNPPFGMASRVVKKLLLERPRYALVMLPDWPSTPWFHRLSEFPSILLPPQVVKAGPSLNLAEPLTNPKWRIRLWKVP